MLLYFKCCMYIIIFQVLHVCYYISSVACMLLYFKCCMYVIIFQVLHVYYYISSVACILLYFKCCMYVIIFQVLHVYYYIFQVLHVCYYISSVACTLLYFKCCMYIIMFQVLHAQVLYVYFYLYWHLVTPQFQIFYFGNIALFSFKGSSCLLSCSIRPPVLLGVTNPFFAKTLQQWPHIIRVGEMPTLSKPYLNFILNSFCQ